MTKHVSAINWKLTKIYPDFGDLFANLEQWFTYGVFKQRYLLGYRYHKGQLSRFSQQDRRKGSKWRAHTARRLFAIRRAVIEMCDKFHTHDNPLWLLKNCPPSGGSWEANQIYAGNPTGKRCHHPLCPWCYLRRFHDLTRIALYTKGTTIERQGKHCTTSTSIGLRNPVSLTVFEGEGSVLLDHCKYVDFQARVNKAIRHKFIMEKHKVVTTSFSEFPIALRVVSPVWREKRLYFRISYIHNEPIVKPFMLTGRSGSRISGTMQMSRHDQLRVEDALRIAQPYPAALLRGQPEGMALAAALKGRRLFSTITLNRAQTSLEAAPPPQLDCADKLPGLAS